MGNMVARAMVVLGAVIIALYGTDLGQPWSFIFGVVAGVMGALAFLPIPDFMQ